MTYDILRYFKYDHLKAGNLRDTSKMFHDLAHQIVEALPTQPETTVSLRKLLEAKDAAVRSALDLPDPGMLTTGPTPPALTDDDLLVAKIDILYVVYGNTFVAEEFKRDIETRSDTLIRRVVGINGNFVGDWISSAMKQRAAIRYVIPKGVTNLLAVDARIAIRIEGLVEEGRAVKITDWDPSLIKEHDEANAEADDEHPSCPECNWVRPDGYEDEGRFCGMCQDYEGTCPQDHCMTCGAGT